MNGIKQEMVTARLDIQCKVNSERIAGRKGDILTGMGDL